MDSERPEDKIKRLMREAVPASNVADFAAAARKRGRRVAAPKPTVQIIGNNNAGVVGNHNHIEINVRGAPRRVVRVEIQPGPEHITDEQAAEIQELVAKVVSVSGKPFAFVWGALKKRFRFTRYQLLPLEKYEEARAYLRAWIVSSKPPAAPADKRKRAIARIMVESNKRPGMLDQVRAYAVGRFGSTSLADLTPGQLNEVIRQFGL